jgi:thioredoxin reductase (NADPH)
MTAPRAAILAVDDDQVVLNAIERDLRQRYGRDYRILAAGSGAQALALCRQLEERGEQVALFVVDQRMPGQEGVDFLREAIPIFPDARKVLLTAYADTEAAIAAINLVGVDYYLLKPWQPPEEHLYPVLDGLLGDWKANARPPQEGIQVVGALWSPECHEIKDFLARNSIPYYWRDVDREEDARRLVERTSGENPRLPLLVLPDGSTLVQPDLAAVAEATGLQTRAESPFYDLVVAGGGPAGLSAAVTASADGLNVLLIERQAPGGQAGNSPKIENFLGFPSGISGRDLTRRAVTQARRFGVEIVTTRQVTGVHAEGNTRVVTMDDGSHVAARTVLIATGAWFRTLELPGVSRWSGAGVYYGSAHTEAASFAGKNVVVVGAANSAAQGLLYLSRYAARITVLIRGSSPTWSHYLDVAIRDAPAVELLTMAELVGVEGEDTIEAVRYRNTAIGEDCHLPAAGVFIFIGQEPQSDFLRGEVEMTDDGYILTGMDLLRSGKRPHGWRLDRDPLALETSIPGVFAAGDVRQGIKHGVAAATGEGNAAVALIWQYLGTI